jgi:hypothetical protein
MAGQFDLYNSKPNDEKVQELRDLDKDKDLEELLNLLQQAGTMPTFKQDWLGGGTLANFKPMDNQITISPRGVNTTAIGHELTHALDDSMARFQVKRSYENTSPEEKQFLDSFSKLNRKTKLPLRKEAGPYRTDAEELRAFGVGNNLNNNKNDYRERFGDPGNHVDTTMAQEAALLRALYKRALENPPSVREGPMTLDKLIYKIVGH